MLVGTDVCSSRTCPSQRILPAIFQRQHGVMSLPCTLYRQVGSAAVRRQPSSQKPRLTCFAQRRSKSSDDEVDDIDISLSTELRQKADPNYLSNVAAHLNVVWNVSSKKKQKPEPCICCGGSGESDCTFCRGSGALTLGTHRFCSLDGCKPCPVCKARGAIKCAHCTGTGFRAAWMDSPVCPSNWDE